MKLIRILTTFLIILLTSSISFSQEDLDEKYTPSGGVFTESNKKKSNSVDGQNIIKFNPALLLRGITAIHYERGLTDEVSAQIGLGKASSMDYFLNFASDAEIGLETIEGNSASLYTMINYSEFKGSTPYISLSTKFFYDYGLFEGSFIELNYRNTTYKYTVNSLIRGYETMGDKDVNISSNSFYITYGSHAFTGMFSHEFYVGFGVRSIKYDSFIEEYIPSPTNSYNTSNTIYYRSNSKNKMLIPSFVMGYIIGIGF